jgi:hypothetical protein
VRQSWNVRAALVRDLQAAPGMHPRAIRRPSIIMVALPVALGPAACSSGTETTSTAGARVSCPDLVLCIQGKHWDSDACQCVPDDAGVTPSATGADAGCVETALCVRGDHWDPQLCRCAPDDAGAGDAGSSDACDSVQP